MTRVQRTIRKTMLAVLLATACRADGLAASRSSTIALTPDGTIVCVVNQDSGSVSLWCVTEEAKDEVREVAVGDEPRTLAVAPDGRTVYVTAQRSQQIAVVDISRGERVAAIPLSGQPLGIVLSADGRRAFVSQFAGDYIDGQYSPGAIAVIDTTKRSVIHQVAVKPFPFALAIDSQRQRLYATHFFAQQSDGFVSVVDTESLQLLREISLPEDDDINGGAGGVFTAISAIAVHPSAPRALVVGVHANVRRGLTQSGRALSHKTTMQAVVRLIDLGRGEELSDSRIISSFSGQAVAMPSAVAFLPSGEHFIDVYSVSHDFKVIAYNERGIVAERSLFELPAGPTGVALTPDGRGAFFNGRWARSVAHVSIDDIRKPRLVREMRMTAEPWSELRALGARVFHNSRDTRMTPNRWLACGCCHLDGAVLSDNLVWEFSQKQKPSSPRLVNTKPLSLTAASSPPILIRGTYHAVQEEQKFIRSFLGGSGFLRTSDRELPEKFVGVSRELDALDAFVRGLTPRPNPHLRHGIPRAENADSVRRGRELFTSQRVGCSRCHQGAALTLSGSTVGVKKLVDVGTGILADVPSLHALWSSAPYLHDGRAARLRDVLTAHNPDDRHGRTSDLTDNQIEDLIRFLHVQ